MTVMLDDKLNSRLPNLLEFEVEAVLP